MKILKEQSLNEKTPTSRLYKHLLDDNWAIISTYRGERTENENLQLLKELKSLVKDYGFNEFISRWVEDGESFDERSLLIHNIPKEEALKLGKRYNQASIIISDEDGCREVCVNPFVGDEGKEYKSGEVVRVFDLSKGMNIETAKRIFSKREGGPASMPVKGSRPFRLKEVYMVNKPRPSYFQTNETYSKLEDIL